MNTAIPPALAPYLKECLETQSLTLLTSVLNTPGNWLITRFLCLALRNGGYGTKTPLFDQTSPPPPPSSSGGQVILISIWRSFDLWNELAKKCGVNLREPIAAKQLCYIDGLSTGSTFKDQVITLKSLTLKELNRAISTALQTTATNPSNTSSKTTVLIDGIDLLLACDADATSMDVQQVVTEVQSKVHSMIITCAADDPLLHNIDASATPLEYEHGALVRSLAYQAGLVFQLRPLETGHSREVDGTVRVSRGGVWEGHDNVLEEGEWLFHVKGDGVVRVWSRGEA